MPVLKTKERETAKNLFVENFWNANDIADFLNIEPSTVGRWRRHGKWDQEREDTINNPIKMKRLIAKQMMLIVQGQPCELDADALSKMYKVYEGVSDKINPGIVAAVIKLQDEFLVKLNPQLALQVLEYNKKFLIHIINSNG